MTSNTFFRAINERLRGGGDSVLVRADPVPEPAPGRRRGHRGTLSIAVVAGLCRGAEVALMGLAALATWLPLRETQHGLPFGHLVVITVVSIIAARWLLERQRCYGLAALLDPAGHSIRLALCPLAGMAVAMGTLALMHGWPADVPDMVIQPAAWALATGAGILAFRALLAGRLQRQEKDGRLSTRLAVVGANDAALRFIGDIAGDRRIELVGVYDDRRTRLPTGGPVAAVLRGSVDDLVTYAQSHPLDSVVIALPLDATERVSQMRARLAGIATDVYLATDLDASSYEGAQFTTIGGGAVLSVSVRPLKDWPAFKKALFDRVFGAAILLMAFPLMLVLAAAVRLSSPGPILFRQFREGLNGAPFELLKFRSMYVRASGDEGVQATADDRRVTRVGYWLRRLSLDELPQLWNVIRGEMSLVGPRPHLATTLAGTRYFHEIVPHYQARHRMKPGLTGWAQVHGLRGETRTAHDVSARVAKDLDYIDNWSLTLDLKIILRTIWREVFSRSGKAY